MINQIYVLYFMVLVSRKKILFYYFDDHSYDTPEKKI